MTLNDGDNQEKQIPRFARDDIDASTRGSNCEKARAAIADAVLQGQTARPTLVDSEIERHIGSCVECQHYREDVNAIWADLGRLEAKEPSADARQRFDNALARERAASPARAIAWRRLALNAAALLIAAVLGFGIASARREPQSQNPAGVVDDSTPKFLLLLYDAGSTGPAPSAQAVAAIIAEYSAWARGLGAAGQLVSAEKLADTPPTWLGGEVSTTTGEHVGGFFLIRARDLAEARRIAQTCPHLKHGGRIELRPIHPT